MKNKQTVNKAARAKLISSGEEKASAKLDFSWVAVFSYATTVTAAVLYGAGKAYRQTYLAVFGFDDSAMPWSFQDLVYLGLTRQVDTIVKSVTIALGVLITVVFLSYLAVYLGKRFKSRKKSQGPRYAAGAAERAKQEFAEGKEYAPLWFLFMAGMGVTLFLVFALVFEAGAEILGRKLGQEQIEAIRNGHDSKLRCAIIDRRVGGQISHESGFLISCSERACALYNPSLHGEESRFVPLDGVVSMKYSYPKTESTQNPVSNSCAAISLAKTKKSKR